MAVTCRTIWCATCATKLGIPFTSVKGDTGAVRWGYVVLPFLSCDSCRGRMKRHDIACAVSAYNGPDEYWGWEEAFLYDMDVEPAGDPAMERK